MKKFKHPASVFLEEMLGYKLIEIERGPDGMYITFDERESITKGSEPIYSIWIKCDFFISDNISGDYRKVRDTENKYGGTTLTAYSIEKSTSVLILELDDTVKLKFIPTARSEKCSWGIYDYSKERDCSITVFLDFFFGYWLV